ncbi:MAG: DUF4912 domain-containing protein [Treponema sp.]|nr:DUF4912 domain-containing protein [Treponema sp.]
MENNNAPVSRQWLETLSTDELIKQADTFGIDIPPGLERIFIIEELLEAANTDRTISENDIEVNPSYSETALLPKQYNISFIEVVIRDPLWIFAFWEVKGQERETFEAAADFDGYFLRIVPMNEEGTEPKQSESTFTISVSADDNARYIGFAEQGGQVCGCYVIKLGVIRGGSELHIASSAPFHLPLLSDNEEIAKLSENPLVRISGVQDLSIIKNSDRLSRVKRQ